MKSQSVPFINNKELLIYGERSSDINRLLALKTIKQVKEIVNIRDRFSAPKNGDFIHAFMEINSGSIYEAIRQQCTTGDIAKWITECGIEAKTPQVKACIDSIAGLNPMSELKSIKTKKAKKIIELVDNCSLQQLDNLYAEIYHRSDNRSDWTPDEYPIICYIKAVSAKIKRQDEGVKSKTDEEMSVNNESLDEDKREAIQLTVDIDSDRECIAACPTTEENITCLPTCCDEKVATEDELITEKVYSTRIKKWIYKSKCWWLGGQGVKAGVVQ